MKKIVVNWTNEKSIQRAAKQKTALENKGYSLVSTRTGFASSLLIYKKDDK